ncbi:hypothetical protein NA655_08475 [Pseudomonas kuykendallii]|uniref:Uncharacterized protein n=1 Tax=Pseudomonas kuykendallii TaxID=1007099 RepID=A0A1H3ELA5_9PSED|nr:hypothetical protein [Pseudomonas kuykendallii]MCQ4271054.1 hypothetical protein [Pseudomonas kuykendallii]SDX79347.1 hypothetical protein SAMN05216287_3768 [Pseudomonas kuykendallii]
MSESRRFKPGDLALIIGGSRPENIGKCVVERNLMPLRGDGYVPLTKASEVPA